MGSFIVIGGNSATRARKVAAAAQAARERGLAAQTVRELPGLERTVLMTGGLGSEEIPLHEGSAGDFVFVAGTAFGRGRRGTELAEEIGRDFDEAADWGAWLHGHYVVLLVRDGVLHLRGDHGEMVRVFETGDGEAFSDSVLMSWAAADRLTPDAQAIHEYLLTEAVLGDSTFFREVRSLPAGEVVTLRGPAEVVRRKRNTGVPAAPDTRPLGALVDEAVDRLRAWFREVVEIWGDNVTCALSGGYDSRLILAGLLDAGARPQVYVYGGDGSADVRIARAVCEAEGLPLRHLDKGRRARDLPVTAEGIEAFFAESDGMSYGGVLGQEVEREERARRHAGGAAVLNGSGGEILRCFFQVPDRAVTPQRLIRSFWMGDPEAAGLGAGFDRAAYVAGVAAKIPAQAFAGHAGRLPRTSVEWLYPWMRCRAFVAPQARMAQNFGPQLYPYLERRISDFGAAVPLAHKRAGLLQGRVIRAMSPALAAYPSDYGHPFTADPPAKRTRMELLYSHRPLWTRDHGARIKRLLGRAPVASVPEHVRDSARAFGGFEHCRRWADPDAVRDGPSLSRLANVELAMRRFAGRLA